MEFRISVSSSCLLSSCLFHLANQYRDTSRRRIPAPISIMSFLCALAALRLCAGIQTNPFLSLVAPSTDVSAFDFSLDQAAARGFLGKIWDWAYSFAGPCEQAMGALSAQSVARLGYDLAEHGTLNT